MKINELKSLWKKEKNEYIKHEIGSGVQNFVNEILMSDDIFKLKKGELSTNDNKRKNEFLLEKTKKQKRADIIIFISNDIIIPVEVEKYKNIKAGEQQIFNYQKAWNKKYGILTDGYTWRFYNNKIIVREFTLDHILEKTSIFLTFWKEYTQIENYYLQFFEKTAETSEYEEDLNLEINKQDFFTDITKLIDNFRKNLNLKGYFKEVSEQEKGKKSVEISYAYFIQFILYKTLADNDFHNFGTDFSERIKRIHNDLQNKNYGDILFVINTISKNISKNIYKPFISEQKIINNTLEEILAKPQNKLQEVTPWLDIFVFIKQYNFANVRNEIFGFIYENYLKQLYSDNNKGQYFTAPEIVDFMLEEIGYSSEKLINRNENEISIIDPSCGSGTFLYSAVRNIINAFYKKTTSENAQKTEKIISENVFGLDVEEFPLYLAEMSIIMKMLPLIINEKYNNPIEKKIKIFKTKDSISEFLDVAIKNTIYDTQVAYKKDKQQMSLFTKELNLGYSSSVRDEDDLKEMKKSLENRKEPEIERFRYDYVIGNPPYISYNQCSKQEVLFFKLIKEKKVKLSDVYGFNLHSTPSKRKVYAPKPNSYAFFIALGLGLLKENGILSYIIPQTLLTEPDYDVLRYHFSKYTTIEKIIIFSNKMFIGRGLRQNKAVATSSLIFVVKKSLPTHNHKVKVIDYTRKSDDITTCLQNISKKKNINFKTISQKHLYQKYSNWNFIRKDDEFINFHNEYYKNTFDFSFYYKHKVAIQTFGNKFYVDGGCKMNDDLISDKKVNDDYFEIVKKVDNKKYNLSENNIFYSITGKLKFPQGSQGLNVFKQKYKIIWRKQFAGRFHYSERNLLIYSNNFLGVFSNDKQEILYLFALLNSPITIYILRNFFMIEDEKYGMFIAIRRLKEYFRIPEINDLNKHIKSEIIERTKELLNIENKTLSDFVDFNDTMLQKIDKVEIVENNLIIYRNQKEYKLPIKNKTELIKSKFKDIKTSKFNLQELKDFKVIDFDRISEFKKIIDNLVFALYFKVKIPQKDIKSIKIAQNLCVKNKYYKIVM